MPVDRGLNRTQFLSPDGRRILGKAYAGAKARLPTEKADDDLYMFNNVGTRDGKWKMLVRFNALEPVPLVPPPLPLTAAQKENLLAGRLANVGPEQVAIADGVAGGEAIAGRAVDQAEVEREGRASVQGGGMEDRLGTALGDLSTLIASVGEKFDDFAKRTEERLDSLETGSARNTGPGDSLRLTPKGKTAGASEFAPSCLPDIKKRFAWVDEATLKLAVNCLLPPNQLYKLIHPQQRFASGLPADIPDEFLLGGVAFKTSGKTAQSKEDGKCKKAVNSALAFQAAWSVLTELVCSTRPNLTAANDAQAALNFYAVELINADNKFTWDSIMEYHFSFGYDKWSGQFDPKDWWTNRSVEKWMDLLVEKGKVVPAAATKARPQQNPSFASTDADKASQLCNTWNLDTKKSSCSGQPGSIGSCGRQHRCNFSFYAAGSRQPCKGDHGAKDCHRRTVK